MIKCVLATKAFVSDLSFNNIEVIDNLDTLTKLEDLTLYSNRISTIENMDALLNLHVLSLGRNQLTDLENVKAALYVTIPLKKC